MSKYVEMGARAVIRPPRCEYDLSELPDVMDIPFVGQIHRRPISFKNTRGLNIIGSFYAPMEIVPESSCIVYLHGNASCQKEGVFLARIFLPYGVSVLCFDFSGCGLSEGEYISLGYYERDDVTCAIDYVRKQFNVGRVALWGRSMGAVTALYALADDPTIAAAVVDSPFASLPDLVKDIAARMHIPGFVASAAKSLIARKIRQMMDFDIGKLVPIDTAPNCFSPVRFVHGEQDDFIDKSHSQRLIEKYSGEDKEIFIVEGQHNSPRPIDTQLYCVMFLAQYLEAPVIYDEVIELLSHGSFVQHFANAEEMFGAM